MTTGIADRTLAKAEKEPEGTGSSSILRSFTVLGAFSFQYSTPRPCAYRPTTPINMLLCGVANAARSGHSRVGEQCNLDPILAA